MTEAILFRLGRELILVFHSENGSRLDPNDRRRVVVSITKFGFAGDWIRCRHQRHRRTRLRQFRKYSVLRTCCGGKQSDACYRASCAYGELLQNVHGLNLSIGEATATARTLGFVVPPSK